MIGGRGVLALALLVLPASALAQSVPYGRLEVSVGAVIMGDESLGSADATQTTAAGAQATLFKTSTVLERGSGFNVRIGVRTWRSLEGEAYASITKPRLATAITGDIENSQAVTATEPVKEYLVGGGALWYLPIGGASSPIKPFVSGGIAYLRQLHESNTLAVTGREYEIGAGIKYLLLSRPTGRLNGLGVRADARLAARSKGVAFDDDLRYAPAFGISAFVRF